MNDIFARTSEEMARNCDLTPNPSHNKMILNSFVATEELTVCFENGQYPILLLHNYDEYLIRSFLENFTMTVDHFGITILIE